MQENREFEEWYEYEYGNKYMCDGGDFLKEILQKAYEAGSKRTQTVCSVCGELKETPLRRDDMGYVCLACIDKELTKLRRKLEDNKWIPTDIKFVILRMVNLSMKINQVVHL